MTTVHLPARTQLSLQTDGGPLLLTAVEATSTGAADRRLVVRAEGGLREAVDGGLFRGQEAFRGGPLGDDGELLLELRLQPDLAEGLADDARGLVPALVRGGGPLLAAEAWFLTRWRGPEGAWQRTLWSEVAPTRAALEDPASVLATAFTWLLGTQAAQVPDAADLREVLSGLEQVEAPAPPRVLEALAPLLGGSAAQKDGSIVVTVQDDAGTWDCVLQDEDGTVSISSLPRVSVPPSLDAHVLVNRLNAGLVTVVLVLDDDGGVLVRSAVAYGDAPPALGLVAAMLEDHLDAVRTSLPPLAALSAGADLEQAWAQLA